MLGTRAGADLSQQVGQRISNSARILYLSIWRENLLLIIPMNNQLLRTLQISKCSLALHKEVNNPAITELNVYSPSGHEIVWNLKQPAWN